MNQSLGRTIIVVTRQDARLWLFVCKRLCRKPKKRFWLRLFSRNRSYSSRAESNIRAPHGKARDSLQTRRNDKVSPSGIRHDPITGGFAFFAFAFSLCSFSSLTRPAMDANAGRRARRWVVRICHQQPHDSLTQ